MSSDTSSASGLAAGAPRSRTARLAVWATLVLVGCHILAIALWVGPDNQARRKIGVDRLGQYVLPMFDQNWSVFAPEADYGNDMFSIRGKVREENGAVTETGWVPVTEKELVPAVRHHPFPSRTTAITNRLASEHVKTFGALGQKQRDLVFAIGADVDLDEERERLISAATSDAERAAVPGYIKVQTAIEYFLSGIAHGVWGDDVLEIQIQRSRVVVPNYETWEGDRLVDGGHLFTSNWRPVHVLNPHDRVAFGDYVRKFEIR